MELKNENWKKRGINTKSLFSLMLYIYICQSREKAMEQSLKNQNSGKSSSTYSSHTRKKQTDGQTLL